MFLRNDNLTTGGVVSVWNWVVHNADSSDDLTGFLDLTQTLDIRGIANDKWGLSLFSSASDTTNFAISEEDLVNIGVQHVGTSMDSA